MVVATVGPGTKPAWCPLSNERAELSRTSDTLPASARRPDPRPGRTKELLFHALLELIQEKRWDKIRVQDILDRTQIGRSTFYAHFDNKFDLLTAAIPALIVPISEADGEPDLLPLFEHIEEMQPVMRPLMSQPLLAEIMDTFHRRLADAWDAHLENLGVPEHQRIVPSEMLAGSFLAVGRRWIADGCPSTPEAMCVEFTSYASAVTAGAVGTDSPRWRSAVGRQASRQSEEDRAEDPLDVPA